jgi:hypothetical protein
MESIGSNTRQHCVFYHSANRRKHLLEIQVKADNMKNNTESQNITFHDITRGREGSFPPPDSPRASCSQRLSLHPKQKTGISVAEPLRSLRCNWLCIYLVTPPAVLSQSAEQLAKLIFLGSGLLISASLISWYLRQKPDNESDAMIETDIDTHSFLNLLFQEKIEKLREQYEQSYANSHDEAFNLITTQMFRELASIMTFSTNSKAFLAKRLQQAANLVTGFSKQYQEFVAADFREALLKLSNFLSLYKQLFEAFALLEAGDNDEDKAKKYISYQQGYQLLGEIANNNWNNISVEIRSDFEILALTTQNKTGFGVKKEVFAEVQQSWKELKKQLDLFWASARSGGGDLFSNYKDAVLYFINSVLKAASSDNELQRYKEEKLLEELANFSTVASILDYVKTAPKWHGNDFEECLEYINDVRS